MRNPTSNCKDSIIIAEDSYWYMCRDESKHESDCTRVFSSNALNFQLAMLEMIELNALNSLTASGSSNTGASGIEAAAAAAAVDEAAENGEIISKYITEQASNNKRSFLPFETLSFGKRSENHPSPKLLYIMGKRSERK